MEARKGVFHLLTGNIVGRAMTFALNIGISRSLGPANLGLFSFILTTAQTFEIIARFGIDYGMQYNLTNEKYVNQNTNSFASTCRSALRTVDILILIFAFCLLIWIFPLKGLLPANLSLSRDLVAVITIAVCSFEAIASLSWEIFLVAGKTKLFALRVAALAPLKLLSALIGAQIAGSSGALIGYLSMSGIQTILIRSYTRNFIGRSHIKANFTESIKLIKTGLPFYATNAVNSAVFLPLLANVASSSGFQDIGYLRIGQLIVQVFTLIPGALAPILFIKLRLSKNDKDQSKNLDLSLRSLWAISLLMLAIYMIFDKVVLTSFFGVKFLPSLIPTRALILAAILDSASQVLHTAVLAKHRMRFYSFVQISSSILAAITGLYLIPVFGLTGFILAKLAYSWFPLIIYYFDAFRALPGRWSSLGLLIGSLAIMPLCIDDGGPIYLFYLTLSLVTIYTLWQGLKIQKLLNRM